MTDVASLYRELKVDLERVSSPLFDCAQQQVRKRGAFLPFGASLSNKGELALHAGSTGEELVSSTEVLPLLHAGLRTAAAQGGLSAVAVCEWVKITPDGGEQTDAIKVLVEHERGLTVAFYVPCRRRRLLGSWRFAATLAKSAEPEVQPWRNRAAAEQGDEADER
jgi:hypothetical protein